MKKISLNKLDLDVYEETLENGLRIFVLPFKNTKNMYITLSTNYGSIQNEFVPYGKKEMIKVPYGIAHFLEHKVFEQKDGVDPFEFFAAHGADANANTTNFKTTYLFSGTKYLKENLNYLLDYVYSPYFTDANVLKEKGIIEQEMRMYEDDPYSCLTENMVYNTFQNHPIKYKVIGDYDSIYSITKENLYDCYNTFYQPSNMFLVATGNVKPKEVISIVKKNMASKKFNAPFKIQTKKYVEPLEVAKKNEIIKMNVNIPKVGIGYKINIKDINLPFKDIYNYIQLFFDIKCDDTSLLYEELKNSHIINDELYISPLTVDDYICIYIYAETKNPKKLFDKIKETVLDKKISKSDFERKKKCILSSLISASDNIYSMNNKMMYNLYRYNKIENNDYDKIKRLSYDKLIKVINKIDLDNYLTYIIKPK